MGPDADLEGRNLGNDFTVKDGWRMYHGQTVPGFPYHPHRGFETITIVNEGFCDHSDSLGAAGRFGQGDVQWMTAGRGVQHSEMFPLLKRNAANPLELFQIWLNLPRDAKFVEPHFKMLWHEEIPIIREKNVEIKVIAGRWKDQQAPDPTPDSWANDANHHVAIWNIHIEPNGKLILPRMETKVNRSLYFYEGNTLLLDDQSLESGQGADLEAKFETSIQNGDKKSHLLVLQGKPILEPVVQYGPFVMNSQQEIEKAMEDYRLTRFGGWPWPYPDQVHEREKGRFALYPDGKLIEK
ncbi:MAG: pirin family protein [Flavobacteriaceae bacterium]